jgi:hypothetical protein
MPQLNQQQGQQQQQQQQRRTFRGRSGPNDRRLPKHDASGRQRRSRRHQSQLESQHAAVSMSVTEQQQSISHSQLNAIKSPNVHYGSDDDGEGIGEARQYDDDNNSVCINDDIKLQIPESMPTNCKNRNDSIACNTDEDLRTKCQKEVQHLQKRIQNVRKSIQLSTDSISSDPIIWQTNVLFAVHNCVTEWRSIVCFYGCGSNNIFTADATKVPTLAMTPFVSPQSPTVAVCPRVVAVAETVSDDHSNAGSDDTHEEDKERIECNLIISDNEHDYEGNNDSYLASTPKTDKKDRKPTEDPNSIDINPPSSVLTVEQRLEVGTVIFGLIQLAMQSGPLKGSQAGYFKRCGSDVAQVAHDFLQRLEIGDHEVSPANENTTDVLVPRIDMGFTSKQLDQLCKWKQSSLKAIQQDKPPSKSVLKKIKKKMKGPNQNNKK